MTKADVGAEVLAILTLTCQRTCFWKQGNKTSQSLEVLKHINWVFLSQISDISPMILTQLSLAVDKSKDCISYCYLYNKKDLPCPLFY